MKSKKLKKVVKLFKPFKIAKPAKKSAKKHKKAKVVEPVVVPELLAPVVAPNPVVETVKMSNVLGETHLMQLRDVRAMQERGFSVVA